LLAYFLEHDLPFKIRTTPHGDATGIVDRLNSCWEFWEPIRGRLTIINDDRYSLEYKTRANLDAAIPRAISIGLLIAANSGWRAHRTKKHQPARLSGAICCPLRQSGVCSGAAA
jgi:hypothetical protein